MTTSLDSVEEWIERQDWSDAVKARAVHMHHNRPDSPLTQDQWRAWAQMATRVR